MDRKIEMNNGAEVTTDMKKNMDHKAEIGIM